jgi:hypothetical protein
VLEIHSNKCTEFMCDEMCQLVSELALHHQLSNQSEKWQNEVSKCTVCT